jgi:hypothetical protein
VAQELSETLDEDEADESIDEEEEDIDVDKVINSKNEQDLINDAIIAHYKDLGLFYTHETENSFYYIIRKLPGISCNIHPPLQNGIQISWSVTPPPDELLKKTNLPAAEFGVTKSSTDIFIPSPRALATGRHNIIVYPSKENVEWSIIEIPWEDVVNSDNILIM